MNITFTIKDQNREDLKTISLTKPRKEWLLKKPASLGALLCKLADDAAASNMGTVHYSITDGNQKSPDLRYAQLRFLSKARKALRERKKCSCGSVILCDCHDQCRTCSNCEQANKTYRAIIMAGEKLLMTIEYVATLYDDKRENEDRDDA